MGTLNNNSSKGRGKLGKVNPGQINHDGQENYKHSNQRNPDNIRNATREKQYKEHDETLTNDENYDVDSKFIKGEPDFDDKNQNVDKNQ
ncbi:hypothetical protein J2X31_001409 [Flavobacterium arsenatis]|uniref:Uncharacterized protein n=1 Tax=Flavobacterium arsenatis TaxID=1484332 RepID=A0ABU1TNE9_9FLAO|nr:hypothetical protein [Flavobacterium arsenatis]MDR6967398.1 hypothetical protein [Flavobacterium arsenatis]